MRIRTERDAYRVMVDSLFARHFRRPKQTRIDPSDPTPDVRDALWWTAAAIAIGIPIWLYLTHA